MTSAAKTREPIQGAVTIESAESPAASKSKASVLELERELALRSQPWELQQPVPIAWEPASRSPETLRPVVLPPPGRLYGAMAIRPEAHQSNG